MPESIAPQSLQTLNKGEGVSFDIVPDYSFAAHKTMVQVGLHELQPLSAMLPLFMRRFKDSWQLMGIMGFPRDSNLLVGARGGWQAYYVPDRLRLHPLCLVPNDTGGLEIGYLENTPRLQARGETLLIEADGGATQQYAGLMKRLRLTVGSQQQIQAGASELLAGGVLMPVKPDAQLVQGRRGQFYSVDMSVLADLPDAKLASMRDAGALSLGYAMHYSGGNANKMRKMAGLRNADPQNQELAAAIGPVEDLGFNFDQ